MIEYHSAIKSSFRKGGGVRTIFWTRTPINHEEFSQEVPRFCLLPFVKAQMVYRLHSTTALIQNQHNLSKMLEKFRGGV